MRRPPPDLARKAQAASEEAQQEVQAARRKVAELYRSLKQTLFGDGKTDWEEAFTAEPDPEEEEESSEERVARLRRLRERNRR